MDETRQYPGLARLPDGRILAVTGHPLDGKSLASAEVYDPKQNTWTPTGALHVARNGVQPGGLITLNSGKILISGSGTANRSVYEAELYDPVSGSWNPTGDMSVPRCVHTTTLLNDGRVLVTGGIDWLTDDVQASAEFYDPATETWTPAGTMADKRWNHRAVRLLDGRVLVAGGASDGGREESILPSAEIFDPVSETWSQVHPMHHARRALGLVLLSDGDVLAIGGKCPPGTFDRALNNVERFDPETGTWSEVAPLAESRWGPDVIRLSDGRILATGGMAGLNTRRASAEIYDPETRRWHDAGRLQTARNGHRSILLDDGRVLIAGGFSGGVYLSSCEIFTP